MAKFSLDLRDLEAAAVLEALGMVPETQWPVTEASTLELSTDSGEVTFSKVLGSAEVLATKKKVKGQGDYSAHKSSIISR